MTVVQRGGGWIVINIRGQTGKFNIDVDRKAGELLTGTMEESEQRNERQGKAELL